MLDQCQRKPCLAMGRGGALFYILVDYCQLNHGVTGSFIVCVVLG